MNLVHKPLEMMFTGGGGRAIRWLTCSLCLLLAAPLWAAAPHVPTLTLDGPGTSAPIQGWAMQSSAVVPGGAQVSSVAYEARHWYPVKARSTVLAGLMANGKYPGITHGDTLGRINPWHFQVGWWYRAQIRVPKASGIHTQVTVRGINPAADMWVDGHEIASRRQLRGAFAEHSYDLTKALHPGINVIAFKVYPVNTMRDFSMSWIDWNPAPPDKNMGIWNDVDMRRTGPVSLRGLHVVCDLSVPDLASAGLTVKAVVENLSAHAERAVIRGKVAGVALSRTIRLAPHQQLHVVLGPGDVPALRLPHPRIWWPAALGRQPLYTASLEAVVDGTRSDRRTTTFGIRRVSSQLTPAGSREFLINGVPLMIRGGGWTPDLFLRRNRERLEDAFRNILNLGLNTVRLEGRLETPSFYAMADRMGILVMPGWECCTKWEAAAHTGGAPWSGRDLHVAKASMASEARLLRNHPSVLAFLIGSDNAPPKRVADMYVRTLHEADWPNPVIAAASDQSTTATGPSGMKMSGPYAWVPPDYWYGGKVGAGFGFNAETSAGASIPRVRVLNRVLSRHARWALTHDDEAGQFHAAAVWSPFSSLKRFSRALAARYGQAADLHDYVEKAQVANFDNVRAQFEAYSAGWASGHRATGVIYWLLNSAWPSLHWHLFTYGEAPAGAYDGAQRANEPLHIQYDRDDRSVRVINRFRRPAHGLTAELRVRNLGGTVVYRRIARGVSMEGLGSARLFTVPAKLKHSDVYFVELDLRRADRDLSRNVYWLSSNPDTLDWAKSNGFWTPVSRYANLRALQQLPAGHVVVSAQCRTHADHSGMSRISVSLRNRQSRGAVAFFVHVSAIKTAHGRAAPILPIYWNRNDVTLWPGEQLRLSARTPMPCGAHGGHQLQVQGWNVAPQRVQVPPSAADRADAPSARLRTGYGQG